MRTLGLGIVLLAFGVSPSLAAIAVDDDFTDGVTGSAWSVVTDAPGTLDVAEQNGRLEAISPTTGGSLSNDSIYLSSGSSGFRLSTASDFEISIDYSFTGYQSKSDIVGDAMVLVFGVGRDLDGTDSAAIGVGYATETIAGFPVTPLGFVGAQRTDDVQSQTPLALAAATGTLTISYDAAGDDLTFSSGFGNYDVNDRVQAIWGADDLLVSFGVRGKGFELASGDAWLDNFVLTSGAVVPEPASLAALAGGLILWGLRRRRFPH